MTKEEILSKHTGETGIYLTKGMVRGSDSLDAMQEYSDLQNAALIERVKELDEENRKLKKHNQIVRSQNQILRKHNGK